jgi:hypothetical protein
MLPSQQPPSVSPPITICLHSSTKLQDQHSHGFCSNCDAQIEKGHLCSNLFFKEGEHAGNREVKRETQMRRDHCGASLFATERHCTTLSARDSTLSCVVNPGAPSAQNLSPFHHGATPSEKQTSVPRSLEMSGLDEMMYRVEEDP